MGSPVRRAAELIRKAGYLVAFTGAGISAESGVPTFRGREGLWRRFRAEELATPQAFLRDPGRVWEWYAWRMGLISRAKPNPAHLFLAYLEELGTLKALITQNVDGLHRRAGSKRVIELHGNIWRARCVKCGWKTLFSAPPSELPPKCERCSSLLRPDVVWFGEPLPEHEWRLALTHASRADVMLVVGTSGVVLPAALIPKIAWERGAKIIEINVEETPITEIAHIHIGMKAGEAARLIWSLLRRGVEP